MNLHVSKSKFFVKYVSWGFIYHVFCFSFCCWAGGVALFFQDTYLFLYKKSRDCFAACIVIPIAIKKHVRQTVIMILPALWSINKIKVSKTLKIRYFISFSPTWLVPLFHFLKFPRTVSQKYESFMNWRQLCYSSWNSSSATW